MSLPGAGAIYVDRGLRPLPPNYLALRVDDLRTSTEALSESPRSFDCSALVKLRSMASPKIKTEIL
jgi:hypothetical protein